MNRDKFIHWYYYISLSLIVILGSILFYYNYLDGTYVNPILTSFSSTADPDKQTYHPGDDIYMKWDYCKQRDLAATLSVTLIDEIILTLPDFSRNAPIGCFKGKMIYMGRIPEATHAGKFTMHVVVKYKVNPMSEVRYEISSTPFTIER